jgi:predicted nucleic acid-binding protein
LEKAAERTELAVVRSLLIDTGPIVAYLDAKEQKHIEVCEVLDSFSGQLLTTSAVITETMHFVSEVQTGPRLLADLVLASDMQIADFAQPLELRQAADLMEKYSDVPMDYADATLVLLAERLDVYDVLTLDHRGFSAYRTRRKQPLKQVLYW